MCSHNPTRYLSFHIGSRFLSFHRERHYLCSHKGSRYLYSHKGRRYLYSHKGWRYLYSHKGRRVLTKGDAICLSTLFVFSQRETFKTFFFIKADVICVLTQGDVCNQMLSLEWIHSGRLCLAPDQVIGISTVMWTGLWQVFHLQWKKKFYDCSYWEFYSPVCA